MNQQAVIQMATQIWNDYQAKRPQYEALGLPLPILTATPLHEVVEHFVYCANLSDQYRVNIDPMRWFNRSHASIEAFVASRVAQEKRRAGVKAVIRKYGRDGAERIVARHTGRHINLR